MGADDPTDRYLLLLLSITMRDTDKELTAQEQALANNVKPTRKPIERGFFDSLVDFARDATIFLTDNAVTNAADQFFSGQANMLTFGATDALRVGARDEGHFAVELELVEDHEVAT